MKMIYIICFALGLGIGWFAERIYDLLERTARYAAKYARDVW